MDRDAYGPQHLPGLRPKRFIEARYRFFGSLRLTGVRVDLLDIAYAHLPSEQDP